MDILSKIQMDSRYEPISLYVPSQDTNAQQLVAKARDGFVEGNVDLLIDVARINPLALYEAYMENQNIYQEQFTMTFADLLMNSQEIAEIMAPYFGTFIVPEEDVDYSFVPDYILLSDFLDDFPPNPKDKPMIRLKLDVEALADFYQTMVEAGAKMFEEDIYQTLSRLTGTPVEQIRRMLPTVDVIRYYRDTDVDFKIQTLRPKERDTFLEIMRNVRILDAYGIFDLPLEP